MGTYTRIWLQRQPYNTCIDKKMDKRALVEELTSDQMEFIQSRCGHDARVMPVVGYSGYWVTDTGDVFSTRGKCIRPLKPVPCRHGIPYLRVCLPKRTTLVFKRARICKVHTLVLTAFIGPRPEGKECRHLDSNPQNNHLVNLAWGTKLENSRDAVDAGHMNKSLTRTQAMAVRERILAGHKNLTIARDFGVSENIICNIKKGRTWRHISTPEQLKAMAEKPTRRYGLDHGNAIDLSPMADTIKAMLSEGLPQKFIAMAVGVSQGTISKFARGIHCSVCRSLI